MHLVGGAVQPLPLGVEHRVGHLPPGAAVEQQCQPHHARHGDEHGVHRLVGAVHLEHGQQGHAGDQAGQDEEEDDEGRDAARLLPLLLPCGGEEERVFTQLPSVTAST